MPSLSIFTPNDTMSIIFIVLGGLGLFLYGIELMSDSLKNLSGNKLKMLIGKITGNMFMGILTGVAVTILIQSSSATTVIVVGLISAGLMTLKQSIGVMMGANIGSTITAFLIGLKVEKYSLIFIAVGAIICLFISIKKIKLTGSIIFGFGLLFLGLEMMSIGFQPLSSRDWFKNLMISMSNHPLLGVLAGTGLTMLIQSSGASIGILQGIFEVGSIELRGALAILIGCNIGTTITAIIASLNASTEAKQASLFHLLFNIFGATLFLILFKPYTNIFEFLEAKTFLGEHNKLTVAFAHIFFNLVTSLLIIFLVKHFIILINKILPIKKDKLSLDDKLNEDLIVSSPVLALENAKTVCLEMGQIALNMIQYAHKYQSENNIEYFDTIAKLEDEIDLYDHKIHDYLMKIQATNLSTKHKELQIVLLDTIRDFERIADHAVNLSEFYKNRYELDCELSGELSENLNHYFDLIIIQTNNAYECFKNNDKKLARGIFELEEEIDRLEKQYRRAQLVNFENRSFCSEIHYVDILANLERISDHCNNIAENIIDPHYTSKDKIATVK